MAKNTNIYKFEIIEHIICARDFTTKEEVTQLAKRMCEIAVANETYSEEVKQAFRDAYREIDEELTLGNLQEIKKIILSQDEDDDDEDYEQEPAMEEVESEPETEEEYDAVEAESEEPKDDDNKGDE